MVDEKVNWLGLFVQLGLAGACIMYLCGCSTLLGIKSYESTKDGSKVEFITGYDFGLQANGIDTVEDRRGIKPSETLKY